MHHTSQHGPPGGLQNRGDAQRGYREGDTMAAVLGRRSGFSEDAPEPLDEERDGNDNEDRWADDGGPIH